MAKVGDLVRQKQTGRVFRLDVVNKKVFQGWIEDGSGKKWLGCGGTISQLAIGYEPVSEPQDSPTDQTKERNA